MCNSQNIIKCWIWFWLNLSHWCFILIILSLGCTGSSKKTDHYQVEKKYFDFYKLVMEQISFFQKKSITCRKTVSVNGQKEEKLLSSNDLIKELEFFLELDINKPAWSDKYTTDSIFHMGRFSQVRYQAIDPKMKTRELAVSFLSDGTVSEVFIKSVVTSTIAQTYNEMYLWPGKGYEINSVQSVTLTDTTYLSVKVICEQ